MSDRLKKVLQFILFFSLGVFLLWWLYKDWDFERIKKALRETDYLWIWISFIFAILSHFSRSLRWRMLIKSLGYKPKVMNTLFAVMGNYLINLLIPRMGEISRCALIKRYEGISFSKLIGTVFIERVVDLLILFLLTIVVAITNLDVIKQFINNNPEVRDKVNNLLTNTNFWLIVIFIIVLFTVLIFLYRKRLKGTKLYIKGRSVFKNIVEGIKTIFRLKHAWLFILHSLFIWAMYFLMLYICFFAFDYTDHLTPMVGLTLFVMGSYGMVAPVSGGMGAWHFMISRTLIVYGLTVVEGESFAFVHYAAMNSMVVVVGIICLIVMPIYNRKRTARGINSKS